MEHNINITEPTVGCKMGLAYKILLTQLEDALRKANLNINPNEYLILRALYNNNGAQQCEISELIGKDKSIVSRCIEGLVDKNLVKTEDISHKCRKVYYTAAADEIKPRIMSVANERHKALTDLTNPDDLKIFINVLHNIIKSKSN